MAMLASPGVLVRIPCSQCNKKFPYYRTSNVVRRFCTTCAEARTTKSKQRFEEEKKKGLSRNPEDVEALRVLRHIPDIVNWDKVLGSIAGACA